MDVIDQEDEFKEKGRLEDQPAIQQILLTIGLTFTFMVLVGLLSESIISAKYGLSTLDLRENIGQFLKDFGQDLNTLRFAQMINTIIAFGASAVFMSYLLTKKSLGAFKFNKQLNVGSLLLVPVIMIAIIPPIAVVGHFISLLDFPDNLVKMQEMGTVLQEGLLGDPLIIIFIINLVMIAVLPAVCEELLFRGILQPLIMKWTYKPHFSIFFTGVLFGAIHMQIINFIPIAMLGVLLGYLYYWTKNIWVPILAHFVFNGFQASTYFLATRNSQLSNLPEVDMLPILPTIASLFVFVTATYLFYTANRNKAYG